jgi:hypothetical protein
MATQPASASRDATHASTLTRRTVEPMVIDSLSGELAAILPRVPQSETASRPNGLRAVGACSGCYQEVAMAFLRAPIRTPAPARVRVAVFAVGRRVYIAGASN